MICTLHTWAVVTVTVQVCCVFFLLINASSFVTVGFCVFFTVVGADAISCRERLVSEMSVESSDKTC